jgi:hypothetical protein
MHVKRQEAHLYTTKANWTTDMKIVKTRAFKNIASIATMVRYFPIQSKMSTVRLN